MNGTTLRCEQALRRLAEYLDHELTEQERAEVGRHLETCRSCFSRLEFERRLKEQVAELRRQPVDADFEERIRGMIRRFRLAHETE